MIPAIPGEEAHQFALDEIRIAARTLVTAMDEPAEVRTRAFRRLEKKIGALQAAQSGDSVPGDPSFGWAIDQIHYGILLVDAGQAVEQGDKTALQQALHPITAPVPPSEFRSHFFKKEYMEAPPGLPNDAEAALLILKGRASGTLDEIASEAGDVVASALKHVGNALGKAVEAFREFAADLNGPEQKSLLKQGAEYVVNGLKSMLALIERSGLEPSVKWLQEAASATDAKSVMALAIQSGRKKQEVEKLRLAAGKNSEAVEVAVKDLASRAARFVALMNDARWLLRGIGAAGFALALTPFVHAAALGTPIAYAVIAAAVVVVTVQFADFQPVLGQVAIP